jgi:hypothetical protein
VPWVQENWRLRPSTITLVKNDRMITVIHFLTGPHDTRNKYSTAKGSLIRKKCSFAGPIKTFKIMETAWW